MATSTYQYQLSFGDLSPGAAQLRVVTTAGDCGPDLTYQNKRLILPHETNLFQRKLTTGDVVPEGMTPERCLCVEPELTREQDECYEAVDQITGDAVYKDSVRSSCYRAGFQIADFPVAVGGDPPINAETIAGIAFANSHLQSGPVILSPYDLVYSWSGETEYEAVSGEVIPLTVSLSLSLTCHYFYDSYDGELVDPVGWGFLSVMFTVVPSMLRVQFHASAYYGIHFYGTSPTDMLSDVDCVFLDQSAAYVIPGGFDPIPLDVPGLFPAMVTITPAA